MKTITTFKESFSKILLFLANLAPWRDIYLTQRRKERKGWQLAEKFQKI